jgi:hypothetical protein
VLATNALLDAMADLLAADPATLAPAAGGCKLHLVQNNFTPSSSTLITDLVLATFDGYAALLAAVGAQQVFTDPVTGDRIIQMVEPLGGWHWETTGTTNLPQTIFGYALTNNAATVLYGTGRFGTPQTLTAAAQGVDIDQARFTLVANPFA